MHHCNVAASKRYVALALRCGCVIPTADVMDSSAVGISQLVLHEVGKSILCMRVAMELFTNYFGGTGVIGHTADECNRLYKIVEETTRKKMCSKMYRHMDMETRSKPAIDYISANFGV